MSIHLRGLHAQVRERAELALAWSIRYGLAVQVTSGHRTWAEQTQLRADYERCLAQGERIHPDNPKPACRYPANRPGDSAHNYGLAWDSWVQAQHQWTWNYLRRWAGFHVPDHDQIHAEVPNWRSYAPKLPTRG